MILNPKWLTVAHIRWLAIGWTLLIFIACILPSHDLPDLSSGRDKWTHLAAFGPIGFLWCWVGYKRVWVLLAGAGFGLLIEIYQGALTSSRSFDWFDLLADTVGVAMGIVAFGLLRPYLQLKNDPR